MDIYARRRIANISGPIEPGIPRRRRNIDVGIFDPDVRVADIHDEVGQHLVAGAGGEPEPVIVRQERYPHAVGDGRDFIPYAAAQRSFGIHYILRTDRVEPAIPELEW